MKKQHVTPAKKGPGTLRFGSPSDRKKRCAALDSILGSHFSKTTRDHEVPEKKPEEGIPNLVPEQSDAGRSPSPATSAAATAAVTPPSPSSPPKKALIIAVVPGVIQKNAKALDSAERKQRCLALDEILRKQSEQQREQRAAQESGPG